MPIIPLLKRTSPIANAPGAVLDTQRRPNVDNRNVQQAVGELANSSKVKDVRASDFTGPTEALGAVGQAISQGGNVLGGLAIKKREAETDIQVAQADQVMQDAFNEHAAWRIQTPDASQWEGNLTQTLAKARKAVEANEKLHPEARRQIGIRLAKFEGDAKADLLRDSAKQTFRQASSVYDASIQRALTAKDYDGALKVSKEAEDKGYRYAHQTAGLEDVISRSKQADEQEAQKEEREAIYTNKLTAIQADPFNVDIGDVPDPVLKDRLENQRRQQISMMRSDINDRVADGIADGSIKTEADIKALESPAFTASEQARWVDVLKRGTNEAEQEKMRAAAPANAAQLDADIRAWDPEADPDGNKLREFVHRKAMLPVGYREDVQELLNRKRKQLEPEPDKIIKDMGEGVISDFLKSGQFGPVAAPPPTGDQAKDAEAEKAASVQRAQASWKAAGYRRAWQKELKANPKMTDKEAQSALSRIMARPVEFPDMEPTSALLDVGREPEAIWNEKLGPYAADPNNDLPAGGSKPQKSLIEMAPQ